jgi:hypothetical protein
MSAFHSCVVVDLWHSLSEWRLLLCACVLVFLVQLRKSGSEIREMLVEVYGDDGMKKTAVYK